MGDKQRSQTVSTKQQRIAELARQMAGRQLTSLSHHIDLDWMYEAYRVTRKDGAVGIDGESAEAFAEDLEGNLQKLLDGAKTGQYLAPAVRRVNIPKGKGKTRPLGIPTFGDKVLQRAFVMALEPVYEQDFLDCSYGFRPGRSAHQALDAIWIQMMNMGGGWLLDLDITGFFDAMEKSQIQEFVRQRVTDGVVKRMIGKWLNAGVMEDGQMTHSDKGTPQGGVMTPPTEWKTFRGEVVYCGRSFKRGPGTVGRKVNELVDERHWAGQKLDIRTVSRQTLFTHETRIENSGCVRTYSSWRSASSPGV